MTTAAYQPAVRVRSVHRADGPAKVRPMFYQAPGRHCGCPMCGKGRPDQHMPPVSR